MSERVVIVGPGRMGLALGTALAQAGAADRLTFYGRALDPPPHPLFESTNTVEYRVGPHPVPGGTTAVILAVPDDAIAEAAHDLAATGDGPPGCAALHLAGARSGEPLAALHAVGYAVGSMHPLQTVADPWSAADRLAGSSFALAGEPVALAAARRLVSAIGGRPLVIPTAVRPLYHAAAVFASNYLVTLVAVAARLLAQAGIAEEDALPALLPLLRGTLDNVEDLGVSAALTGPVVRGDLDTVRLHLARVAPAERDLYRALGRQAVRLARAAGLDDERAAELEALLDAD
ncbi:MAG: Rossmann-like and DUF2520 domain-containing protein [Gemmatimonadota bacterium]